MLEIAGAAWVLVTAAAASGIPEIVVTARRSEEPLSQLPLSASVFDAGSIERLGARSLDELSRFTPGFSFDSAAGRGPNSNRPTVRGLTTIRNGIANSTVAATFIDGVYLGGSSQSTQLYDLERVEVLRGPQSAQFGRATYAGAINYVTRRPSDTWTAGVNLTGAEHDTQRANGWVSGPVAGDWLRFHAGAGYDTYEGEYRNTRDGSLTGGEESRDASLKLEATPTADLGITLRLAVQQTDDDHYATWLQPRTANNCCFRSADAPRAREYYIGEALGSDSVTLYTDALDEAGGAGFELDRVLGSLAVNWSFGGGYRLSSLTGAVHDDLERGFDSSYGAYDPVPSLPGTFLVRDESEQDDFSQELRLSSPTDRALRWTAGLYFYDGSRDETVKNRVIVAPDDSVSVLPQVGNRALNDVQNRAVFGALDLDLSGTVTAGLELRYAADEVGVDSLPNDVPTATCQTPTPTTPRCFSETFRSLTPRFTLSWQATPRLMPYLNVGRGVSPGTFNPTVPDESYRDVDEEEVWNYEVGLRGSGADERARFAIAAYHLDVRDQQFTTVVELPDGRTAAILDNVGRTEVDGVEFEVTALLGDNLTAGLTYAWTNSEIREQISEEQADLLGSDGSFDDIQRLGNVAGKMTPRVPEHAASIVLEYRRPRTDGGDWFAGGDWSFTSSRFAQEDNFIETGDRSLLGLHGGIGWQHLELRLWVTNLTDDDTPVDVQRYIDGRSGSLPSFPQQGTRPSATPRGFAISLPPGRQVGGTLSYRF